MRASIFSQDTKIASDLEKTVTNSSGSFAIEKSDNFSVIQSSSGGDVLPMKLMDVSPITIETIEDKQGRLSNIIDNYCESLEAVCVPLSITQILPQVKNLKRYDIVEYEGKRFATAEIMREDVLEKFKAEIIETLSQGLSYETSLETPMQYEDRQLTNLVLTAKEQSFLISIFRNYHAYICYSKEQETLMLRVDGIKD